MPELVVSVDAALKGLGNIAVSNVLGSNIYNVAFVLGVISMLKVIPITESLLHRDGLALLGSVAVGGVVIFDLAVSRIEGGILVGLLILYIGYLLRAEGPSTDSEGGSTEETPVTRTITDRVSFRGRNVVFLIAGLALVLVSGDFMVLAASELARGVGISEWVVGGTIVAAGTSTPEFAVSLVAIRRGSLGVSVGNVIGSNIYNITGILGVAALIRPLVVSGIALETLAWLAAVSGVVVAALWTNRILSRLEGALFTASEIGRWALGLLGWFG